MAATEKTTNYGLPVYKEDDTTTWADYNQSMQLIDAQMKRNADAAASGGDIPADVEQRLDALEENDKTLSQALTGVANQTGKNTTDITSLKTSSSEQGSELSSLSGSVSALSSTTADHETRIHAVEVSAAENHTDILAAEQRIAVNENEIAIFNQEISDNQTNIAALQVDNTKNKQDIANLETWQSHALPGVEVSDITVTGNYVVSYYTNPQNNNVTLFSLGTSIFNDSNLKARVYGSNYCLLSGMCSISGSNKINITNLYGMLIYFAVSQVYSYHFFQPCLIECALSDENNNGNIYYPAYAYSLQNNYRVNITFKENVRFGLNDINPINIYF